jgi:energy-coupling factor transporter ATP-binding protein EcfA2
MEDVFLEAEQTLLLTTHDVHFAHRVGSRVLTLNGGRLSTGLSLNALRGEVREGRFLADPGLDIPLPAGATPAGDGPATLILDPRRIVIQPRPGDLPPASGIPPASGSEELLRGRVASVREQGDDVWLEVDCGRRLTAIMSREEYEEKGLNLHQVVVLSCPPGALEVS